MKLDIGCGHFPREGFVGVDLVKHEGVLYADLEKGLDDLMFTDCVVPDSVEEIWADNVLEHITNLIQLMNHCHFVLKPGGLMHIRVPVANTTGSLKDPTHVRQFVKESFDYFDKAWDYERQPDYGIQKWNVVSIAEEVESDDYKYLYVVLKK